MIQFDLPKQKSSIIKVLGVGGGGSNAVNFMFHQDIEGVDFIICNTDSKAIEQSPVPNKIQLGPHLTQGLGAGADPSVGKLATEESLEEIKRILEVNTKMAFITVGMGGGTGTGGAPIIAKICKDLGILTVGIVTTPFGFEGPRRQKQAEDGINQLKPLVDTLLVISNDKLRVQYGNLKMKEAFTKADNVLATAAKCITDVINSRGHIIVDFADVCTVMKNGGVAILGKAEVEGENRAQRAIEEALNSPLLNDNDIKGAKWILLNINSAEGDFECSMDELETISNILRERTGEHSDVIMGSGYDDTLGEKIGITLIATGFEGKDPFKKEEPKKAEAPIEEKIVMTLATEAPELIEATEATSTTTAVENSIVSESINEEPIQNSFENDNRFVLDTTSEEPIHFSFAVRADEVEVEAPIVEEVVMEAAIVADLNEAAEYASLTIEAADTMEALNLIPTLVVEENAIAFDAGVNVNAFDAGVNVNAFDAGVNVNAFDAGANVFVVTPEVEENEEIFELNMDAVEQDAHVFNFSEATAEFVLSKPSNIYAEEQVEEEAVLDTEPVVETMVAEAPMETVAEIATEIASPVVAEVEAPAEVFQTSFRVAIEEEPAMQLVMREEENAIAYDAGVSVNAFDDGRKATQNFDMPIDDSEEQRRKVRERIQKLRNLSFNIGNGNDPSAEFDEVPAYVRRNMDLFGNTLASVENYYSKYTVEQDENNQAQISTINTFLDGKKPD